MWLIALLFLVTLMVAAYKSRTTPVVATPNQGVVFFDDFLTPAPVSGDYKSVYFSATNGGAGPGTVDHEAADTVFSYPGCVKLNTDIATSTASMKMSWAMFGSSLLDLQTRMYVGQLGTGGQAFNACFGVGSLITSTSSTDQAIIYYDQSVSDNFVCAVSNNGNATQTITSTPVVALTDTYLRIIISTTLCRFFINNVLVATINDSPSHTSFSNIGIGLKKNVGNSNVYVRSDAISVVQNLVTPRTFAKN